MLSTAILSVSLIMNQIFALLLNLVFKDSGGVREPAAGAGSGLAMAVSLVIKGHRASDVHTAFSSTLVSTGSLAQQYTHPNATLHPHTPHPQPSATPTGQQQSQHGGSHPAPSPVQVRSSSEACVGRLPQCWPRQKACPGRAREGCCHHRKIGVKNKVTKLCRQTFQL